MLAINPITLLSTRKEDVNRRGTKDKKNNVKANEKGKEKVE